MRIADKGFAAEVIATPVRLESGGNNAAERIKAGIQTIKKIQNTIWQQ